MKNIGLFIGVALMLSACGKSTPNQLQIEHSISNLSCYQTLIDQIVQEKDLRNQLYTIRDSKKRGLKDPISILPKYRRIEYREIKAILDEDGLSDCQGGMELNQDFKGLRLWDERAIIIEIDDFRSHRIADNYSKEHRQEYHRLIWTSDELDKNNFYFNSEYQIWEKRISENLIYEVSHVIMRY